MESKSESLFIVCFFVLLNLPLDSLCLKVSSRKKWRTNVFFFFLYYSLSSLLNFFLRVYAKVPGTVKRTNEIACQ